MQSENRGTAPGAVPGAVTALAVVALTVAGCAASITPLRPRPEPRPAGEVPRSTSSTVTSSTATTAEVAYFGANPLMVPVVGISPDRIPDSFNESRDGGRTHRATDILAAQGTPVVAAEPGSIIRMSQNSLGGTTIYMRDDSAHFIFYYAHLDGYAAGLAERAHVSQGDLLGYVGMTGNAPVPHLHFQVMRLDPDRRDYWNDPPVDVRPYFTLTGRLRGE